MDHVVRKAPWSGDDESVFVWSTACELTGKYYDEQGKKLYRDVLRGDTFNNLVKMFASQQGPPA